MMIIKKDGAMNTATQRKVENPLLSVIVPVYNAARFIPRCLESLLGQTYRNLEIICVNDGSADDSAAVLDAYAAKDSRVKVIHKENAGVSEARNRGLALAKGDIIGFCDADDVYERGALDRVAELFVQGDCDIVVTGLVYVNELGKQVPMRVDKDVECSAGELQQRMLYQDCIMGSVCNKFFRRELIAGLIFDETLTHCEDMHFVSQVLKQARHAKVLISPSITYVYQLNSDSATRDCDKLLDGTGMLKYVQALEKIMQMYPHSMRMWLLIRSCQFRLIEENLDVFEKNPRARLQLAKSALRYVFAYLVCRKRHPLRERLLRTLRVIKNLRPS